MTRGVTVIISDSHGGHASGLVNPDSRITDLQSATGKPRYPKLNHRQLWLWEQMQADVAAALAFAGDDPLTLAHLGDPTQGNDRGEELTETAMHAQIEIAAANLEPWLKGKVEQLYLVSGTSWHEFQEGSATALLLSKMQDVFSSAKVRAHEHPLVNVGGVTLDLAHHGPAAGSTEAVAGNALRNHVKNRMIEDLQRGRKPPAVMAYGHYHTRRFETVTVDWAGALHHTHGVICPPYCLPGAYGVKAGKSPPYVGVGIEVFEVVDGQIGRWLHLYHELELRGKAKK